MHIMIVNFQLADIDEAAFRALCEQVAPAIAAVPGLIAKIWLADAATDTYGGVYTWESRAAFEAYTRSELFQGVASSPRFTNVTVRDFAVHGAPTQITRGPATIAA